MQFSTTVILSFLSLTAFTSAYYIDSPSASLRLRDLEVRDLYETDLYERSFDKDLSIRSLYDDLFARDLYAEGFLHARSLYGRAKGSAKASSSSTATTAAKVKKLREELASSNSALHTMQNNPLQEADGVMVNRLKTKIMNIQGEIMAANQATGGELR
ncbi:hypothetical protein MMC15_007234 [Xylographa vitiligo]|nr:hypothetical protein [Xylographa vitiligo]